MLTCWPVPTGQPELAVSFDQRRARRVLVLPALFDEANKLRRFTVEIMRLLDAEGIDSLLPDLPGCNESPAPLDRQTIETWRAATQAAAHHFGATQVLAIRGGALLAPALPGWRYAAVSGESLLRGLLRARVLASKEAGLAETREGLLEQSKTKGLELAGYALGRDMVAELAEATPADLTDIGQAQLGGAGLWLRAEPDHDPGQANALAQLITQGLAA